MAQSHKTLDFKCALVTGGGGGIGKAMATHLVSLGKKVLIAGRTESNLKATSSEIGAAGYYVLDTGKVSAIPDFISRLTKEHPEVDCIINNAGVQRPLDVNDMAADEFLSKADQEIDINVRGPMHLTLALLPHFRSKEYAVVMNVSSVLGYIPTSVINPVYNATKAWVHFFSMNLRSQLAKDEQGGGKNIRVVEIAPPSVGTDLHRERADPDDNKKHKNQSALSVEEFMDELKKGWDEGRETIGAGMSQTVIDRWYREFGADYEKAAAK